MLPRKCKRNPCYEDGDCEEYLCNDIIHMFRAEYYEAFDIVATPVIGQDLTSRCKRLRNKCCFLYALGNDNEELEGLIKWYSMVSRKKMIWVPSFAHHLVALVRLCQCAKFCVASPTFPKIRGSPVKKVRLWHVQCVFARG